MLRNLLAALILLSSPLMAAPASQQVTADRLVAVARAQIDEHLGSDRGAAQVSVVGTPEDVAVPVGALELKGRLPNGRWPRARVGVPVDISVNGQVVRSATVWFALAVHRQVLSYMDDAALGTSAASIKFDHRDIDIAEAQGMLIQDPADVAGMRLRHPVLADAVAVRGDFESVPEVDRQQRVDVVLAFGSIHMQTKGTAISKGNTGDVVPVLVDAAEAPVRARITDKGVVQVVQ